MESTMQLLFKDPEGYRINCNSFQQDALVTFEGYQFAVGYDLGRYVVLGRRPVDTQDWQWIRFEDYKQELDDGHNVACVGISGDGVVHLIWDLHNMVVNYRYSEKEAATSETWNISLFSDVKHALSELKIDRATYPRFLRLDDSNGDLLLEIRIGRSGLGDDYLYRYSALSGEWTPVGEHEGMYLKGIGNNAYINGIDYHAGKLHVSWTYRDFVEDGGGTGVAKQAGPNGPENNHDLYYAYSPDEGVTWYNSKSEILESPIAPGSQCLVYEIPKYSGIMNQEGQAADENFFHVLNRENGWYYHYWLDLSKRSWNKTRIEYEARNMGNRGQLVASNGAVIALLPGNTDDSLTILKSDCTERFKNWQTVYQGKGFDVEPVYDRYHKYLSVLVRESKTQDRNIGVIDFPKISIV